MTQQLRFFFGPVKNPHCPRTRKQGFRRACFGSNTNLSRNFGADRFEIQSEIFEDVDGDSISQPDETKQKVFSFNEAVIHSFGLFLCQHKYLPHAWSEIAPIFSLGLLLRLQLFETVSGFLE